VGGWGTNWTQQCRSRGPLSSCDLLLALAAAIPSYATAPALILVGALMTQSIAQSNGANSDEAVPAFMTMLASH